MTAWREPHAAASPDPIETLAHALVGGGAPPLAWVVRWSAGGAEPVAAAWAASRHAGWMLVVLRRGDPAALAAAWAALRAHGLPIRAGDGHGAAVRGAVPTPPTLAELLR